MFSLRVFCWRVILILRDFWSCDILGSWFLVLRDELTKPSSVLHLPLLKKQTEPKLTNGESNGNVEPSAASTAREVQLSSEVASLKSQLRDKDVKIRGLESEVTILRNELKQVQGQLAELKRVSTSSSSDHGSARLHHSDDDHVMDSAWIEVNCVLAKTLWQSRPTFSTAIIWWRFSARHPPIVTTELISIKVWDHLFDLRCLYPHKTCIHFSLVFIPPEFKTLLFHKLWMTQTWKPSFNSVVLFQCLR